MRTRKPLALAALVAGMCLAAETPTPVPSERIEVRLAQFDVVVRDKKGAVVTGLGKDEFSATEDGTPMEIVAVDEWGTIPAAPPRASSGPPPSESATPTSVAPSERSAASEPERRSFVFVFDSLGDSTALRMSQAKQAATKFVRTRLRSDDVAAVYQLDLGLHALTGVTSNAEDLAGGIAKVTWMAASSLQDDISEAVVSSMSRGTAPLAKQRLDSLSISASQQLDWQRENVYASLKDLAAVFRGLPGRRILVLASPGFPMSTAGDARSGSGGFTPKFRDLIRELAAYGVTVYSLDIGNDLAIGDVGETIDWRVAVGTLGMDENVLADLGLERSMGSGSASSRREFLGVIAGETGGRMLTPTDLSKAFEIIQEESTHFYRISCRVRVTQSATGYRKLVVRVKTPGYTVSSRRGRYSDITPQARPVASSSAAVESIDRYRALTARGVAFPLPGTDPKKVPMDVVLEVLGPIELPLDARGSAALDVEFRLVARAEGEVVDRYERSFTARVKPEGVAAIKKGLRVEGRLALVPGLYEFQGSVRLGDPPQLASWSATVPVPPSPKASPLSITSAFLTAADDGASPLLTRPPGPDDADSLVLKPGVRLLPATQRDFESGNLMVLFWLRGPVEPADKPPKLDLSVTVVDGKNRALPLPTEILFFGREPAGGYRALARIEAASLSPDAYSLRLTASMAGGDAPAASAHHAIPFSIRAKGSSATSSPTSSSAPTP